MWWTWFTNVIDRLISRKNNITTIQNMDLGIEKKLYIKWSFLEQNTSFYSNKVILKLNVTNIWACLISHLLWGINFNTYTIYLHSKNDKFFLSILCKLLDVVRFEWNNIWKVSSLFWANTQNNSVRMRYMCSMHWRINGTLRDEVMLNQH